jgi:hypothetical protein
MLAIIGGITISGLNAGKCYDGGAAESRWGGERGDLAGGGGYGLRQVIVKRRSGLGGGWDWVKRWSWLNDEGDVTVGTG